MRIFASTTIPKTFKDGGKIRKPVERAMATPRPVLAVVPRPETSHSDRRDMGTKSIQRLEILNIILFMPLNIDRGPEGENPEALGLELGILSIRITWTEKIAKIIGIELGSVRLTELVALSLLIREVVIDQEGTLRPPVLTLLLREVVDIKNVSERSIFSKVTGK